MSRPFWPVPGLARSWLWRPAGPYRRRWPLLAPSAFFNLLQQGMTLSDAETLVAAIFKVPSATAKRMVNSAVARYAIELQQGLSGTIGEVLEAATWDKERERWDIGMPATFIRERILEAAARLPVPDPSRAAGSLWRFPDETYQAVRKEFGLSAKPPK
jgi:hypothetical protein